MPLTSTEHERRRLSPVIAIILLALTLGGCARYATTDYDPRARFAEYTSYRFDTDNQARIQSLDAARIERALTRILAREGLTKADEPSSADLAVHYRIEQERRFESRGPTFGLGVGFGRSPFGFGVAHSPVESREITEGRLVVELIDPQAGQVIWQGKAEQNLRESMDPDERSQLINRVIKAMFEQYPPE